MTLDFLSGVFTLTVRAMDAGLLRAGAAGTWAAGALTAAGMGALGDEGLLLMLTDPVASYL